MHWASLVLSLTAGTFNLCSSRLPVGGVAVDGYEHIRRPDVGFITYCNGAICILRIISEIIGLPHHRFHTSGIEIALYFFADICGDITFAQAHIHVNRAGIIVEVMPRIQINSHN
jgi:hypothetical protein